MNRNWTDKIQVTLLFVSISWKKEYLHDFKASLEEVIVMLSEGNEGNEGKIHKGVCLKECRYVNFFTGNLQGFWLKEHIRMATSRSYTTCLKGTCEIVIAYSG